LPEEERRIIWDDGSEEGKTEIPIYQTYTKAGLSDQDLQSYLLDQIPSFTCPSATGFLVRLRMWRLLTDWNSDISLNILCCRDQLISNYHHHAVIREGMRKKGC
jgi:hypothetical protein